MQASSFAPAKVNLTLHVTGRRGDGYHLLDSVVVFAGVGDVVSVAAADEPELRVTGPFAAAVPAGAENLALRAVEAAGARALVALQKNLPVASGLGGGSADAAAVLRALREAGLGRMPDPTRLGADVPVCLKGKPARMSGVGEVLAPLPPLPPVAMVLLNPGVPVSTAAVFGGLSSTDGAPMPRSIPAWPDASGAARWLAAQRNDLQEAALGLAPEIGEALDALAAQPACLLARMSGSGATVFGLFATPEVAEEAAAAIGAARPDWWVVATQLRAETDQERRDTT